MNWINKNKDIVLLKNNSKYLSFDILYNIILNNELVIVCNEEILIECVINWYKYQKEKKIEELKELLKLLNWNELNKRICIIKNSNIFFLIDLKYFDRYNIIENSELEIIIKESKCKSRKYTGKCLSNNNEYNDISCSKMNEVEEMILRFPMKEEIYELLLERLYLYKRLTKMKIVGNISTTEWKLLCETINDNHLSLIESIECENVEMNDEYLEYILDIKRKEKEEEKEENVLNILKCSSNNNFSTTKLAEVKEYNLIVQIF